MSRADLTELWVQYAPKYTRDERVFMAGVGLINDGDNVEYYSHVGMAALLRAAEAEVYGTSEVKQEYGSTKRY